LTLFGLANTAGGSYREQAVIARGRSTT